MPSLFTFSNQFYARFVYISDICDLCHICLHFQTNFSASIVYIFKPVLWQNGKLVFSRSNRFYAFSNRFYAFSNRFYAFPNRFCAKFVYILKPVSGRMLEDVASSEERQLLVDQLGTTTLTVEEGDNNAQVRQRFNSLAELGTFGIFECFNNKKWFCIFCQVHLTGSGLFK